MAEVFAAVASGAGLVSLSIQLIDSAQKLKKLFNASKDAPTTVADLCFELENMSLSLRQLDTHRNANITGDELLGRCFTTCTRMVMKVGVTVSKIERLMRRCHVGGRLYMAFKEPEIQDLLGELERAKSAMSFAYMSYCHSWSLSEAARNVVLLTAQNDALSSHILQLHSLKHTVQDGNAMILDRLTVSKFKGGSQDEMPSTSQPLKVRKNHNQKRRPLHKIRIALPRYFTNCVWEFGLQESGDGWAMQLHPINERPSESIVFDVVRSGRVPAVRALLESGSLSMQDQAAASEFSFRESLLDIAATMGHLELCEFLLEQSPYLRDETRMLSALNYFASGSIIGGSGFESARRLADDMYDLFLDRFGLVLPMTDEEHHTIGFTENLESSMLLTERSLRKIQAGQFTTIHDRAFEFKFSVAMRSIGWPADALINFLQPCNASELATAQDHQARTALHWAAKHFGYWTCVRWIRDVCSYDTKAKSYAELATQLLKMGSNPHAVNALHETPLMTMVRQVVTFTDWPYFVTAVKRWGDILVEAELDLGTYVQVENSLLQSLAERRRVWDGETSYALHPAEMQLTILHNSTLAVQIKFCRSLSIWERWVPPGAWDRDSRLPSRSIGMPLHLSDDEQLYWRETTTIKIYSRPYLIQASSEADRPFYSSEDFEKDWRALFEGVQDDHGIIATTISRGRSRKQAGSSVTTARALSVPPEMTHPTYNELPTGGYGLRVHVAYNHWIEMVYRCPFELRWKVWGGSLSPGCWGHIEMPRMLVDFDSRDIGSRLFAADDWEVQLLREQGDLETVKKFAQRFCPVLKRLVDEELEREKLVEDLLCGWCTSARHR